MGLSPCNPDHTDYNPHSIGLRCNIIPFNIEMGLWEEVNIEKGLSRDYDSTEILRRVIIPWQYCIRIEMVSKSPRNVSAPHNEDEMFRRISMTLSPHREAQVFQYTVLPGISSESPLQHPRDHLAWWSYYKLLRWKSWCHVLAIALAGDSGKLYYW